MLTTSGQALLVVGFMAFLATISFSVMSILLIQFMKNKKD